MDIIVFHVHFDTSATADITILICYFLLQEPFHIMLASSSNILKEQFVCVTFLVTFFGTFLDTF